MTLDEIVSELIKQRVTVQEVTYALVRRALYHYGNIQQISINHGISRPTVLKRMREFGITADDIHQFKRRQMKL